MKKIDKDYIKEITEDLKGLKKEFPNVPICMHIGLATSSYSNIEDIPSDKEFAYLLNKYYQGKKLELDTSISEFNEDEEFSDFSEDDEF